MIYISLSLWRIWLAIRA